MNNYDLAILIPARNEAFLSRTVEGILSNKRGKTQVIVVLDGQWADPGLADHPDLTVIYFPESVGQRAATNHACRLTKAKYVMKIDAHVIVDEGFDVKLMNAMQGHDNWTIVPLMRNLHAFDWVCTNCKSRQYQGPSEKFKKCDKCGGERVKEIVWKAKESPKSTSFCFDPEPHFQYFNEFRHRPEGQGEVTETMSLQGSCFMLTRNKYWELDVCNEEFGSWGSQGIEVAVKTWLSGGKVMCLQSTWYAHLFRTQGGDFGFPYHLSGNQVQHAKKRAKELFFENKWEKQIYPLSWLLDRFSPVPRWTDEDLARVREAGAIFSRSHSFTESTDTLDSVLPLNESGVNKQMSSSTVSQPTSGHVVGMTNKSQVEGITTSPVITDKVIQFQGADSNREGSNQPSVHESVDSNPSAVDSTISSSSVKEESSVSSMVDFSSPDPTFSNRVKLDMREETSQGRNINGIDSKEFVHGYSVQQNTVNVNKKEIIFYTDNKLKLKYAHAVQKRLRSMGLPILSVSLKPMPHFGKNIHIPLERGVETYFKQIITALENSQADIVYMCEHDVLYHPSHFDFIPPTKDKFYYNQNFWRIRPEVDTFAVHWDANQVSGLVAYREPLLAWYKQKWEKVQREGFDRSYEPGGRNSEQIVAWKSAFPNVDIRHGGNLTKSKWSPNDFRDKSTCVNWQEGSIDTIPGWDNSLLAFV